MKSKRITPEDIKRLNADEIFVFGSNESGIHGSGAAKLALQFGARYGQGFGTSGSTFALPTKDWEIETLPLYIIDNYVQRFLSFARTERVKGFKFLITQIGCGLAGYTPRDVAPLFEDAIDYKNVYLPQSFIDIITSDKRITSEEGI